MARVYIGIGHGGNDPGACANGLRESDLNLAMGFLVREALEKGGAETKMSRTADSTFPTAAKVDDANRWGADVVIDLHHNAGGGAGLEVYHSTKADGSKGLAAAINNAIAASGRKSRGLKTKAQNGADDFGIIRRTDAPAVLIEYGFLDNRNDAALLTDAACQKAWAAATAKGVLEHLGLKEDSDMDNLTSITGKAQATASQMSALLLAENPGAPDYATIYLEEGEVEGIRGDIAFAQACLETGYWRFGGDVDPAQNNFCGLGAVGGGEPGCSFATPREGIRAQIQHLKAYACGEDLAQDCVDPRFRYVQRGVAPYVEWLGIPDNPHGKGWASGSGYGGRILAVLDRMTAAQAQPEPEDRGTITIAELRAMGYSRIAL